MPFITKTLHASVRQKTLSFLIDALAITRSEAQKYIDRGRISQNGIVIVDPFGYIEGDIELICFEPLSRGLKPVFVTNDFVVYDKPSGLRVHPFSRYSPYTLNDEIKHQFGNDANATHRIDQETSGLVLVSRHKNSEHVLKQLFANRLITKRYLAMVQGHMKEPLTVHEPLLRHDDRDLLVSMVVRVHPDGKDARTHFRPLKYFPEHDVTLVEASPLTGRTHQIRVHLFHVKHPIIGDPIYGQEVSLIEKYIKKELNPEERFTNTGATRLLLHAHELLFEYDSVPYHVISEKDFVQECFDAMNIDR